jgi:hypothetical protein
MYAKIAQELDKVASNLEAKGLTKEAEMLDVIANTLEKLAFDITKTPVYRNLSKAVQFLGQGKNPGGILSNLKRSIDSGMFSGTKKSDPAIKSFIELVDKSIESLEKDDKVSAKKNIEEALVKYSESSVGTGQGYNKPSPGKDPLQDMAERVKDNKLDKHEIPTYTRSYKPASSK